MSKRKLVVIFSLVILLIFVGYINNQLTKKSLLESSSEYQKHEEMELAEVNNENSIETVSEGIDEDDIGEDLKIVDSRENEVIKITNTVNNSIEENISRKENREDANYFIEYRLSRDKMRASLIERLNEIISNDKTSQNLRDDAQKEIIRVGNIAEKELYIEGLIKAKGFEDALVFLTSESARIVVSVDNLSEQDVMQILEIVKNETSIETSRVTIMKKL